MNYCNKSLKPTLKLPLILSAKHFILQLDDRQEVEHTLGAADPMGTCKPLDFRLNRRICRFAIIMAITNA